MVFLAPISHENTINDDEAYQSEPDKICKIIDSTQVWFYNFLYDNLFTYKIGKHQTISQMRKN